MRWKGRRQSQNVEDRRGTRSPGRTAGGGALGSLLFALFRRGNTKVKILLVVGVIAAALLFKVSPLELIGLSGGSGQETRVSGGPPPDTEMRDYLATMLADNETVWQEIAASQEFPFRPAKMIIYTGRTSTPGGVADARMGPFYMPANETIYVDPSFFNEFKQRFGATGDFAEAYVIAHEYGHHIQALMGITRQVHRQRGRIPEVDYNRLSVRLELQADFLAGVFAHHGQEKFRFLESGDIEEAMRCAEAIGDDRIQKMSTGDIRPDLFTHGTSAQRARWYNKGLRSGKVADGDTFSYPDDQL